MATKHQGTSSIPGTGWLQQFGRLHHAHALQRNLRPSPRSLRARASYFHRTILQKPSSSSLLPPHHHHQLLQPPRCNGKGGGVHSIRHSGVQLSFAHSVWPLAAIPLPLSDVGRKTKGIQTTHTIRAQLYWHGLCHLTDCSRALELVFCFSESNTHVFGLSFQFFIICYTHRPYDTPHLTSSQFPC